MTDDINADTTTAKPLDYDIRCPDDGADATVTIRATAETQYGTKAVVESDYEAKDDIKALDWNETHRTWVGGRQMSGDVTSGAWLVDIDAVEDVRDQLLEAGHKVSLNMAVVPDDTDDDAEPRDVDFDATTPAVSTHEPADEDAELVTDGGTTLTEHLPAADNIDDSIDGAARITHAVDGRGIWSPDDGGSVEEVTRYGVECSCGEAFDNWGAAKDHADREHGRST